MKKAHNPTLADSICDLRVRKIKKTFFLQINDLLDWNSISATIDKYYTKGKSATGQCSYDGLLLLKMCLVQAWYGLSDYEVEDRINDSISFSYFCGMSIEQRKLKNHILKKGKNNKDLSYWEKIFNKKIGKIKFKVERTFGGIKLWFNGGLARYRGIEKMQTQNLMQAICYNLYRSPGIIVSNCQK